MDSIFGLGTLINTAAIIVGGILGMLFGKKLPERFQNTLMTGVGISVMFLGIGGTMEKMLTIEEDMVHTQGSLMLIVCLALGAVFGELLNIDGAMEKLGIWLKKKSGSEEDAGFVGSFLTASFTVCIGAMAVVGSIQDGIYHDPSTLIAKALLDLIIIMIMTASMGKGCIFSAIPVFVFQGVVTLLSKVIEPILTNQALDALSMVGSTLIFCVGVNLLWKNKVKVANLLPAIIFAVLWGLLLPI